MNYKDAVRLLRARDEKAAKVFAGSLLPSGAQFDALDVLGRGIPSPFDCKELDALAEITLRAYEPNAILAEQLRVLAVYVTNIGESPYEIRQACRGLLSAIVEGL